MLPAIPVGMGVTGREPLLPEGLEVGGQGIPLLDLIAVLVPEDACLKVSDGAPVGHLGLQRQQSHGLALHCAQHLGGVHPGDHPVELIVLHLIGAVLDPAICHTVEKHPVGVEGVVHPRHIELGSGHQGRHRGIHLGGGLQLLAGEVHPHQGEAGGAVAPHPHGQHVESHGRRDLPFGQGGPQHSVGGDRHGLDVGAVRLQVSCSPKEGIGRQLPQGVPALDPGDRGGQVEVRPGEHLVIGQAIPAQIGPPYQALPPLHQTGDVLVFWEGLVDGDQPIVSQDLASPLGPVDRDGPQGLAIGPGRDDIGAVDQDRLLQGSVGVARDDQVDPLHLLRQPLVFRQLFLLMGPCVGQTDDELGPLLPQGVHTALGIGDHIPQSEPGGRGAGVGVLPHEPEDPIDDPAPLQEHMVLDVVGGHGPLDVQLIGTVCGGLIVGHQKGRGLFSAAHHSMEHLGEARPPVVELVVAHSGGVIAQGPHGAQLRPLGGIQGLDQRADREVSPVQGQRVGMGPPLSVQGGLQTGVAPRLPPFPIGLGEEMGVQIVGEQHCRAVVLRRR